MRRSRFSIRLGFAAVLIAFIVPALAAQRMPVPESAVEAGLKDYLSRDAQAQARAVVKSELAPTYGFSDEDILGYPHKFFRDCYYYWEGTYGQLIRETVSIYFRKVDESNWTLSAYKLVEGEETIVQKPTKPLPEVPAPPTSEQLSQAIYDYLPSCNSSYNDMNYKIEKLEPTEPKFDWYGIDYQWGGYQYDGMVTVTGKAKKVKGLGLGSVLSTVVKSKAKYDFSVNMLYGIADKQWHAEFRRMNEKD